MQRLQTLYTAFSTATMYDAKGPLPYPDMLHWDALELASLPCCGASPSTSAWQG